MNGFFRGIGLQPNQVMAYRKHGLQENRLPLGILALVSAVLQALALFAARTAALNQTRQAMFAGVIGVTGLVIFGLYFLSMRKKNLPVGVSMGCQGGFVVWMLLTDVLVCYQGIAMPGGWLYTAPMLLLAATMIMPAWASAILFGIYTICLGVLLRWHGLLAYGLCLGVICYFLSRFRAVMVQKAFLTYQATMETKNAADDLSKRLNKSSTFDKELPVHNRRAMSNWLEAVWPLCVRNQIPVLAVLVSLQGKSEGKYRVATALKALVRRQSDFLGLFDQDTFVILYSGPQRNDALMLMDWVRTATKELPVAIAGVYTVPKPQMVTAQLLTKAEELIRQMPTQGAVPVFVDYED